MANERTSIFDGLHRAFHAKATRAYILTERVVWVFIVLSVLLFIVDLQIAEDTRLHRALALTDDVLLLGFAVELLLRITSYRPPELAIFHKSHTARALASPQQRHACMLQADLQLLSDKIAVLCTQRRRETANSAMEENAAPAHCECRYLRV